MTELNAEHQLAELVLAPPPQHTAVGNQVGAAQVLQ